MANPAFNPTVYYTTVVDVDGTVYIRQNGFIYDKAGNSFSQTHPNRFGWQSVQPVIIGRTTAQIAAVPSAQDLALGYNVLFYDASQTVDGTHPLLLYTATAGGYYLCGGSGGGASSALVAYNAQTNSPAISSGTAPTSSTNYIVTNTGITTLPTPIDGITAVRQNDILSWTPALVQWVRLAGPRIAPQSVSGPLTLNNAYSDLKLICSSTPSIKLPTGLTAGFGVALRGAFTFDGTGLTIGSGVTDFRTATGLANMTCVIDCTGTDTYDLLGNKT